ncbi:hypothetical protein QOZ80_4BG0357340 [Eleusine coracana subsp. coracana]|nr:hypothetical protein QOZ80_4BG0357340 [Eleusine coracana subsp. coracana]
MQHMQRFIEKRKRAAGHETLQCQSRINSLSSWQFEVQISRAYSRAVFLKIRGTMKCCGAYRVETDPTLGDHHYLVQHTSKSNRDSWSQHKFKVTANASNGSYMCECKRWEHTGLFCVHLLRVFMQLNVKSVPATYILRRYSRNPHKLLPFDRNDLRLSGSDGTTHSLRTTELLTEAMGVVRAAAMSSVGRDRAMDVLRELHK